MPQVCTSLRFRTARSRRRPMCSHSRTSSWSRSRSSTPTRLRPRSAFRLPVAVERALNLDEPDDVADQRKDEPQAGEPTYRARLPVEVFVHVAHLRRDDEERDRRDQDVDDEPDHPTNAVAGVALDLLLRLVRPDERVDPQG